MLIGFLIYLIGFMLAFILVSGCIYCGEGYLGIKEIGIVFVWSLLSLLSVVILIGIIFYYQLDNIKFWLYCTFMRRN